MFHGRSQHTLLFFSRALSLVNFAELNFQVSDNRLRLPESLYNVPPKFTLSEFRVYVFPVLASLASYHAHLEPNLQQRLIKCLEVRGHETLLWKVFATM